MLPASIRSACCVDLVLVGALVLAGPVTVQGDGGAWKAGVTRAKITPERPLHLAGYASRNRPFEGVAADLYVKALALEDAQGNRAVLVTSDLIGFRADVAARIWEAVKEKSGLGREQVLLNSSHTHTGPQLSLSEEPSGEGWTAEDAQATVAYTESVIKKAAETVARALDDLKPVRLLHGTGVAGFVMNRREPTLNGVRLGVNARGLADRSVPVLRVETPEGELRAVLFGAACHNTTLTGQHYVVSGDYAGFAQTHIEEQFPGAESLFITGCGGSANPYPRGTLEFAQAHGTELGAEVCRVVNDRKGLKPVSGPLQVQLEEIALPLQRPPSREEIDRMLASRGGWEPFMGRRMMEVLEKGETLPTEYRTVVAVWQFGNDLTLVGLPGEVVVDYVPLIAKALGPLDLWISAYCNDVFGYLPSAEVLEEGGYETRGVYWGGPGLFSPQAQDVLVASVREMASRAGRDVPERGGDSAGRKPHILILGDSISIGYTPFVREMLASEAVVIRPMRNEKQAENCSGTTYGVEHVERWLKLGDGRWDVIHFNFGLHDLKRVDPETGAPSVNPEHPRQASPEVYEKQLREIVQKLKASGAKLIFATTTPVPSGGVRPHRDVEDPQRYNEIARKVMEEHGVAINDLFGFAEPRLGGIQRPVNVHFTDEGSRLLAEEVVRHVQRAIPRKARSR